MHYNPLTATKARNLTISRWPHNSCEMSVGAGSALKTFLIRFETILWHSRRARGAVNASTSSHWPRSRARVPEVDRVALSSGMPYDFLVETFATERLKTLGVWSQFTDDNLEFRPAKAARSVREHMVHQCLSEDGFFTRMLGLPVTTKVLPETEACRQFLERYLEASGERLAGLRAQPATWFEGTTRFFDVDRSRAWVLVRRISHTAHHRGQLSTYHRLLDHGLYSIYGPTADTGGLPANGADVIYRYASEASVLNDQSPPPLPGPGAKPATERPGPTLPHARVGSTV